MQTTFPHIIRLLTGLLFFAGYTLSLPAQPEYKAYDNLLSEHVRPDGRVDYSALKSQLPALREICQSMTRHHPDDTWTRSEELAFWINVYNASTLLLVAEHYPISSILELDNGKTWQVPRIRVGDRTYTLDQIEKDKLIGKFRDPRIHLAINCAAISCPPLLNRAYRPETIDRQLDERTRAFIQSPHNDITSDAVRLSEIFRWYAADFGDLRTFLRPYTHLHIQPDARIEYMPYKWELND